MAPVRQTVHFRCTSALKNSCFGSTDLKYGARHLKRSINGISSIRFELDRSGQIGLGGLIRFDLAPSVQAHFSKERATSAFTVPDAGKRGGISKSKGISSRREIAVVETEAASCEPP